MLCKPCRLPGQKNSRPEGRLFFGRACYFTWLEPEQLQALERRQVLQQEPEQLQEQRRELGRLQGQRLQGQRREPGRLQGPGLLLFWRSQ